jgi:signal transduction histidine kinase/ActR/RegA family two-component response regulator
MQSGPAANHPAAPGVPVAGPDRNANEATATVPQPGQRPSHIAPRRLYRWFNDIPISRKLYATVGAMAMLIGIELFVLFFSLGTLSSLRAYVGGEGLWSKAEKDAVFHLYRYGVAHDERDYQLFEQFMGVPLGDAKARQALGEAHPDPATAAGGFLEGRNHPEDVRGMAWLFIRFGNVYYLRQANDIWGEAEALVVQLPPLAEQLRREVRSPTVSQDRIDPILARIYEVNERLTNYEDQFSFILGEGSRWLERVVLRILFLTALTVETTGILLAVSVSRGIQRGLASIIGAADAITGGDLAARAKVLSGDEIGRLAGSFNAMAGNLQARVAELDHINRDLGREVAERQQAEEKLHTAIAQLETTLTDLEREACERLRAEQLLRESSKMQALGQLTGGIAHDFNNMLCVIIGSAELLMDGVEDKPDYRLLVQEIIDSAENGSQLTRRLLAVGRKQILQPQRVELDALLAGHVELLRRTLGDAIEVDLVRSLDLWPTSADPSQIADALLNLALNARDAMPDGGCLTLRAANVRLDDKSAPAYGDLRAGDYVALSVADTGTGMPSEVARRALEPFFTTKPPASGSGLGLSMAYGFAKQSGGHLAIESTLDRGTTVTLMLPRADGEALSASEAPRRGASDPRGSEAILVVDDNRTLLSVTRRYLAGLGYAVTAAAGGLEAFALLRSGVAADLLFTDIMMPGLGGRALAHLVREVRPGLRVLYTTGYGGRDAEVDGIDLLRKPYDRHKLACAVRSVLDQPTEEDCVYLGADERARSALSS